MKKHRYHYLDSSRGIAAFAVVLHHFICCYVQDPVPAGIAGAFSFMWDGSSAVAYFFVLSGFILSVAYFNGQKDINKINYGSFILQRILRIYPLFVICLLISFVCNAYVHWNGHFATKPPATDYVSHIWQTEKSLADVFKEAILIIRIPSHSNLRLLPQDWTLTLELIMSFFVPVLVLTLRRNVAGFVLLFALIFNYETYILPFAVGILLARFREPVVNLYRSISFSYKSFVLVAAIFFISDAFNLLNEVAETHLSVLVIMQSIGAALALAIIISSTTVKRVLTNWLLVKVGRLSFGVYLTHFFILVFGMPYFMHSLNDLGCTNKILTLCISFVFLSVGTIAVSAVLHEVIELPFIQLAKDITSVRSKRRVYFPAYINFFRLHSSFSGRKK